MRVRNDLAQDTSIHWHGLLLPPGMGGVPVISVAVVGRGSGPVVPPGPGAPRRGRGGAGGWPGANGIPSENAPEGSASLHVSAGLGTSPFAPVRFACRPEASLVTLTPRA